MLESGSPDFSLLRRAPASLTTKHATIHTLRHTAAMNLLAAEVDLPVIALWLGHADTHSTDAYLPRPAWLTPL